MKKVKFNDTYIYIDDSEVDDSKTGVVIKQNEDLEKTKELFVKNTDLEDTMIDVFGDNDEK